MRLELERYSFEGHCSVRTYDRAAPAAVALDVRVHLCWPPAAAGRRWRRRCRAATQLLLLLHQLHLLPVLRPEIDDAGPQPKVAQQRCRLGGPDPLPA